MIDFSFTSPVCLLADGDESLDLFRLVSEDFPVIAVGSYANHPRVKAVMADLDQCLQRVDSPLFLAIGFTDSFVNVFEKYPYKNIIFFSEGNVIFRLPKCWVASIAIGTQISFYPLKDTRILSASGFKYDLDDLVLKQGESVGTENENFEEHLYIEQEQAGLLCIMPVDQYGKIRRSLSL